MANPIFTLGDDIIDLNKFNLDDLESQGIVTNDALSGNDTVTLSETQNIGELFKAGDGRDTINGSSWGDYVSGGDGTDWLYGNGGVDQLFGGGHTDRLYGGDDNDVLQGQLDRDYLYGDAGDDDLYGGDGSDLQYGGVGLDDLYGGDGADQLYGEADGDMLSGNTGNDQLRGGTGADTLISGQGRDVFIFEKTDMDGSVDTVRDLIRGEDMVRLSGVTDARGQVVDSFGDLDTNSDGVLDGRDANVTVRTVGNLDLTLTLGSGSLVFKGVTQLNAADFDIVVPLV